MKPNDPSTLRSNSITRLLPSSEPRWKFESEVEVANVSSLGSRATNIEDLPLHIPKSLPINPDKPNRLAAHKKLASVLGRHRSLQSRVQAFEKTLRETMMESEPAATTEAIPPSCKGTSPHQFHQTIFHAYNNSR
jgi:hypothetical protein